MKKQKRERERNNNLKTSITWYFMAFVLRIAVNHLKRTSVRLKNAHSAHVTLIHADKIDNKVKSFTVIYRSACTFNVHMCNCDSIQFVLCRTDWAALIDIHTHMLCVFFFAYFDIPITCIFTSMKPHVWQTCSSKIINCNGRKFYYMICPNWGKISKNANFYWNN